jgi:hypothetical protein
MFGASASKGKDGMAQMMKFMMMSQIMGGNTTGNNNNMLPMMLMMNGGESSMFDGMLDGMFDFNPGDVDEEDEELPEEDEE